MMEKKNAAAENVANSKPGDAELTGGNRLVFLLIFALAVVALLPFAQSFAQEEADPKVVAMPDTQQKVQALAEAIARAEGFYVKGSVPARLHNPGDISDGSRTFGYESHSGSNVTTFPNDETGWQWLRTKINNIVSGKSKVYSLTMTFNTFAQKWAGNWQPWVLLVTRQLGVSTTTTLEAYFTQ